MNAQQLKLLRVELLRGCSLACVHCSAESSPSRWEQMSFEQVKTLLVEAGQLGADHVVFTGGEPLEYQEVAGCLLAARNLGLHTTLFTTGVRGRGPTKKVDHRLLTRILPLVDNFTFSLYSHRPQIHDQVTTVSGSWELTVEASRFVADRDAAVSFSFLPLHQSYADLIGVAKLAQEIGVQEIRILKLMPQGRAARNSRLADPVPQTVSQIISRARQAAPGVRIRTGGAAGLYGADTLCEAPGSELCVDVAGWVSPCPGAAPQLSDDASNCFRVGLVHAWRHSRYLDAVRCLREVGLTCASDGCLARRALESGVQVSVPAAASRV